MAVAWRDAMTSRAAAAFRGGPPPSGGRLACYGETTMPDNERTRRLDEMLDRVAELRRYL